MITDDIDALIESHFTEAHGRVPQFYQTHFGSTSAVLARHWRNKKDIPRDIAHIPIKIFRWGKGKITGGNHSHENLSQSGKDTELMNLLLHDLLAIPTLEENIQQYIAEHTAAYDEYQMALQDSLEKFSEERVLAVIENHIQKINIPREGSREVLVFLALGIAGKAVSHQIAFGSSLGLGSALATSMYISQQSWLGAIWIKFTGVPAWVTVTGASSGLILAMLLAPLITPFSEVLVNRLRGEKFLHQLVDEYKKQITQPNSDALNLAGHVACYIQSLPELIQALKMLKL